MKLLAHICIKIYNRQAKRNYGTELNPLIERNLAMKRVISILLIVAMIFAFTSCGTSKTVVPIMMITQLL